MEVAKTGSTRTRALGRWFDLDAQGRIVNAASWSHVPEPVLPLMDAAAAVYRARFGDALHSAYVHGSVVLGDAVAGIADLDTFALVRAPGFVFWETPGWAEEETARLGTADGFLTAVDFGWASYHDDLDARNPTLAAIIATRALCIAGDDLVPRLRPRRPGPDMLLDHRRIREQVDRLAAQVAGEEPYDPERVRAALKRLLRVGFELVMEREGRYATGVYLACESFGRHRPEDAAAMCAALELYLDPQPSLATVERDVLPLARRIADEAELELAPHAPVTRSG